MENAVKAVCNMVVCGHSWGAAIARIAYQNQIDPEALEYACMRVCALPG